MRKVIFLTKKIDFFLKKSKTNGALIWCRLITKLLRGFVFLCM